MRYPAPDSMHPDPAPHLQAHERTQRPCRRRNNRGHRQTGGWAASQHQYCAARQRQGTMTKYMRTVALLLVALVVDAAPPVARTAKIGLDPERVARIAPRMKEFVDK